ncbi:hypothetical protein ES708_26736 [subsurface metagenome]
MSKEAVRLSADRISDKWGRHMKAAVPDIQAGLDAMTVDPGQKAVDAQEKMKANLVASIDSGIWAKRRLEVSKADFVKITKEKVGKNLNTGVDAGMPKRKKFDNWLVGRLNAVLPEVAAMPDMTFEDSMARIRRQLEHMKAEKYKAV